MSSQRNATKQCKPTQSWVPENGMCMGSSGKSRCRTALLHVPANGACRCNQRAACTHISLGTNEMQNGETKTALLSADLTCARQCIQVTFVTGHCCTHRTYVSGTRHLSMCNPPHAPGQTLRTPAPHIPHPCKVPRYNFTSASGSIRRGRCSVCRNLTGYRMTWAGG